MFRREYCNTKEREDTFLFYVRDAIENLIVMDARTWTFVLRLEEDP